jgi:transposase InsO family protein
LKGPIRGRPDRKTRNALLAIITAAGEQDIPIEKACAILDISSRKVRRWRREKPRVRRSAWNRIRESEREAIIAAAWDKNLIGLPISHLYVHGLNTGKYCASLTTIYRVLKAQNLVRRRCYKRRAVYTSVHDLLDEGWSVVCYDGTCFRTTTGVLVWALPVLLLPARYLLCVGSAVGSFTSADLQKTVAAGIHRLPESLRNKLMAHSDRGSQMKSKTTRQQIEEWLSIPVHFGRPRVKDDHAWIESLNKTMKYHRECPAQFVTVLDIQKWLDRFTDLYNHDPHSSLAYVTPEEALLGKSELILKTRKEQLYQAREARRLAYRRTLIDVSQK